MCRPSTDPGGGRICPGPASPEHRNATRRARYAAVKRAEGRGEVQKYEANGIYVGRVARRKERDAAKDKPSQTAPAKTKFKKPSGLSFKFFGVPIPVSAVSPGGAIDPTKIADRAARDAFVKARAAALSGGLTMEDVHAVVLQAKQSVEAKNSRS